MKSMTKKFLGIIVVLSLIIQLVPFAATAETVDKLQPADVVKEGVATLSKTAERIGPDEWKVTLSVNAEEDLLTRPLELVILMDISGSMAWCTQEEHTHSKQCLKNGCTKEEHRHSSRPGVPCAGKDITESRQYIQGTAVKELLTGLSESSIGASVSICTFGNTGYVNKKMTALNASTLDSFLAVVPTEYKNPPQFTDVRDGLIIANKQFSSGTDTLKMMLVLCDGEYTGALPVVTASNIRASGVIIDCVGFTYMDDVLKNIATDGHFQYAEDGLQLQEILNTYFDSVLSMITDTMGTRVLLDKLVSHSEFKAPVVTSSTLNWEPLSGTIPAGESVEIVYTVRLSEEYMTPGIHTNVPLNEEAKIVFTTADSSKVRTLCFPVPLAHYEVGRIDVSYQGVPADFPLGDYSHKAITDYPDSVTVELDGIIGEFASADGVVYEYQYSVYTSPTGKTTKLYFEDGEKTTQSLYTGIQKLVHIYAPAAPELSEYQVKYVYAGDVPDGADALPADASYLEGTTGIKVASSPAPVQGYVFSGWRTVDTAVVRGEYTMPSRDVTFTGVWTRVCVPSIKYAVSYVYTGLVPPGAPLPPETKFYEQLTPEVAVEAVPTMENYVFVGWFTRTAFVVDGQFTMPMHHVVFYGYWLYVPQEYTVSYEYIGDVPEGAPALPETKSYSEFKLGVAVEPEPELANYRFVGWTTDDVFVFNGYFKMPSKNVVFYGYWEYVPQKHTVTYAYEGVVPAGAPALPAARDYTEGDTVTVAVDPTLPTYRFSGWKTSDAEIANGKFTMPADDVLLVGSWEYVPQEFTVSYEYVGTVPNGAPTLPAPVKYTEGTSVNIAATPVLANYNFHGWSTNDVTVTGTGFTMPRGDVVFYGTWQYENQDFTVSYYYTGTVPAGAPNVPAAKDYTESTSVNVEAVPTLDNYRFIGWTTDDVTVANGSFIMPRGDVVFYGEWEYIPQDFTVSYRYEGTVPNGAPTVPGTKDYTEGTKVDVESAPVLANYTFSGWKTTDAVVEAGSFIMPAGDVEFVGTWTYVPQSFVVSYKYEGNVPTGAPELPADKSYTEGTTVDVEAAPALAKYTFSGWVASNVTVTGGKFVMPDENVEFVGTWTYVPQSFKVTYQYEGSVPDGAPALPTEKTYTEGNEVAVEVDATLAGWIFSGWKSDDVMISGGKFTMPASDVVVKGSWTADEKDTYTVTYEDGVDGMVIAVPDGTTGIEAGTEYDISAFAPEREGYAFVGWKSSADGVTYKPGSKITVNSDIVLTAIWEDVPNTGDGAIAAVVMLLTASAAVFVTARKKRKTN